MLGNPQENDPYGPLTDSPANDIRIAKLGKTTSSLLLLREGALRKAKSSMRPYKRTQAKRGDKSEGEAPL